METVVNDNELITHRVHRHEPPVTAAPLNIIHQDEDLVVLDKPASIPVSSCIIMVQPLIEDVINTMQLNIFQRC